MESDVVTLQDIYTFDYSADGMSRPLPRRVGATGIRPFAQDLSDLGVDLPNQLFARLGL